MKLALTIFSRLLGCHIVGHAWHNWCVWEDHVATDYRVCLAARCQRFEVYRNGAWSVIRSRREAEGDFDDE